MDREKYRSRIRDLKRSVGQMLAERARPKNPKTGGDPSIIWTEVIGVYGYLMSLAEDDFVNIRFHTGLLTGESIHAFWHAYPPIDPDSFAKESGYALLTEGIPDRYHVGEPPTPRIPRPIGVEFHGRTINCNVVRYQKCITNLYHTGVLARLENTGDKKLLLEIGAGYGALAHYLGSIVDDNATFLILDLPEMLLFSGAFLIVNNPNKSIYVYDETTFGSSFLQNELMNYDYVLLPNYVIGSLLQLPRLDLAVNMQSFQEMTENQIATYADFLREKLTGCLYSDNVDRHPYNTEPVNVSSILSNHLCLWPPVEYYDSMHSNTADSRIDKIHRTYIGYTTARDWVLGGKHSIKFFISCLKEDSEKGFSLVEQNIPIDPSE